MRTNSTRVKTACGLLALAGAAITASAQTRELLPPENEQGIEGRTFMVILVLAILAGIILVGAFLKATRGHQD
jgi:hypothetical protein